MEHKDLTSETSSETPQDRDRSLTTPGSTDSEVPGLPDELWDKLHEENVQSKWTALDKVRAVVAYSTLGTSERASKQTGVPPETIRYWKRSCPWWKEVAHHVYKFNNDKHIADLTSVILSAGEELADRVKNGEPVYDKDGAPVIDPETGQQRRKKLTAHQLAVDGIAIPGQRRALLMGDPTSRTDNASADTLRELKELFQAIGIKGQKDVTKDSVVIDHDIDAGTDA